MSEWIQPPTHLGKEYIKNENIDPNKRQSKISKLGKKVIELIGYKSESLSTSQEVYEYFSRICNNNEEQLSALVNLFESSCDSHGFDFAVQEVLDSVLSGDLPRPKGLANSFALIPNSEIYDSENGYKNVLNSSDNDSTIVQQLTEPTK